MADLEQAVQTQLRNIEAKTGKTRQELAALVAASGLAKHAEQRTLLMERFGLGYGDANTMAHFARSAATAPQAAGDPLDAIYAGTKAGLRPLHEAVMAAIAPFGNFESAPKKGYVSLRRKKQFAMVGPATKDQIEIGLNVKELPADARLKVLPPGGMCQYTTRLSRLAQVDGALQGWLRRAFDAAG